MTNAIEYYVDGEKRYLCGTESLTQGEYDAQRAAYDRGQRRATQSKECPEAFNIING